MSIAGILGGIVSGGTLGVGGAIGSAVLDFFKTKENNKHQLAVLTAQKDLALANANSATLLETIKMMGASYEHDKAAYTGPLSFVDLLRGTLRPIVTYLLLGVSVFLTWWAFERVGVGDEVIREVAKYGIYTCLDLTALCVSWYFGARQIEKTNRSGSPAPKK